MKCDPMTNKPHHTNEHVTDFEQRKQDHIRLALAPENEALGEAGLDAIQLIHEALPECDFADIEIHSQRFGKRVPTPFLISSMTAGHHDAININEVLATAAQERGWAMGVGSQRRQLFDVDAAAEWRRIRQQAPRVELLGNIGISQAIHTKTDDLQRLVDSIEAVGLFIHTNPLQECLQPEGTPNFRDALKAIERIAKELPVPVIIKETGCGFSKPTLQRLIGTGIAAVDVSGYGGTHWGRIEGQRSASGDKLARAAQTFRHWGYSTVNSLVNAIELEPDYAVWASGGVRSGLDAAKLIAMGADTVGLAKPMLAAALNGVEATIKTMDTIEHELKIALFCTGCENLATLQEKQLWTTTR